VKIFVELIGNYPYIYIENLQQTRLCGARSGSPQLYYHSYLTVWWDKAHTLCSPDSLLSLAMVTADPPKWSLSSSHVGARFLQCPHLQRQSTFIRLYPARTQFPNKLTLHYCKWLQYSMNSQSIKRSSLQLLCRLGPARKRERV